MMKVERIVQVGIDQDRCLFVRPERETFPYIYRAGADIRWNEELGVLVTNAPRDMSYLNWFRQILRGVRMEYGTRLTLSGDTEWIGVPDDLRLEIIEDRHWRDLELDLF